MDVKLHSAIKHRIVGYYYGILKNVLKSLWSYYYVDLFAGDGECRIKDLPKHIIPFLPDDYRHEWAPPCFSLIGHAEQVKQVKEDFSFNCIFNDLDSEKVTKLKEKLKPFTANVLEIENKDANIYYKRALKLIGKPNRPSLFYLDPTNHEDLKFSTIRGISQFTDPKTGRKPELIINLMAYSMLKAVQRNRPEDIDGISNSLGTNSWIEKKEGYMQKHKTHELFRDIFIEQLESLGYNCTWYCVKSAQTKSPQYYLIFATYSDKIYAIHKDMEPNIRKLQQEEWVKKIGSVTYLIQKVDEGQKRLNSF